MAKLLVSCDEYIYHYDGHYYAANEYRRSFLKRYFEVFDSVRFVLRCIEESELKIGRSCIDDDPNIEIVPIPIFHGPVQYLTHYFEVGKSMENVVNGCDAAILRLPSTIAQRLYPQIKKKGIPYAIEVVFDAFDGAQSAENIVEKVLWKSIDKRMRSICYNADGVSCVTEHHLQKRYYSLKKDSFKSFYSSLDIDSSFFTGPRKYPSEKQRLCIAHTSNQIGLHGRKGAAVVLDAVGLLKKRGVLVDLEFAGEDRDGSEHQFKEYASRLGIEDQVKCVGFLTRPELSSFLENADLCVIPTLAEGLPRVIIEALAKGLPTITTPVSGNIELLPAKYLVEYNNIEELANRIQELLTDPDSYETASSTNYRHSLQYESSILQKRRIAFYTDLKNIIK